MARTAEYWKSEDDAIRCVLCPRRCWIDDGDVGVCRVRKNEGGTLIARSWGRIAASHEDPIEKKPLYHFHPGSEILSIGAVGCNLRCAFCQNWQLVDGWVGGDETAPAALVRAVEQSRTIGLAFTYNEPLIWFEYIKDTAPLLRAKGLAVVLVSNGYVEAEPLAELLPAVDAWNIDLKSIDARFYKDLCDARLAPVQRTIERVAASAAHLEVTTLLVPGENDDPEQVRRLAEWVASVSRSIPLHLSRYHPSREFTRAATDADVMVRSWEIAKEHLDHVYIGNLPTAKGADTHCANCRSALVRRDGYRTRIVGLDGSRCAACGSETGIVV